MRQPFCVTFCHNIIFLFNSVKGFVVFLLGCRERHEYETKKLQEYIKDESGDIL